FVARGKLPIVCGGTGFYIDAFLHGGSFPPVKPDQKLRTKLSKKTTEELMRELRKLDPRRAKEIDPNNKVRIIRSIEIARAIGSVPPPKREERYETLSIGLFDDREKMHERIHTRLIKRIKLGMAREVSHLHAKGVSWKRLHEFGLEYRYLALYLQGLMKKEEMLAKLEQEIFNFSKRQMTWFKRDKSIHWIKPGQTTAARKLIARFLK
ncbi:MAG TPA: tRNA dimethylallyltransferase, partial [Candidatus Paceibacterota bacterium]|nr:tRNA dimethylallyltransferase [Candidatus Paceibacterota bacterium]